MMLSSSLSVMPLATAMVRTGIMSEAPGADDVGPDDAVGLVGQDLDQTVRSVHGHGPAARLQREDAGL